MAFLGDRPDIIAIDSQNNSTVLVECGPCRISKVISYLQNKETVLWVIQLAENAIKNDNFSLFIVKRCQFFDTLDRAYHEFKKKTISSIDSPLDKL